MKVAVFGGGSSYTPELVKGFLDRAGSFPLTELWLADISQERLDVVGGFAQRMIAAAGAPFKVVLTTNQRDAIRGASYVTTQLRVGGMQARRDDEYLGKRHGLIGQETTGVGGMAKALRTIPVILSIARRHGRAGAGRAAGQLHQPGRAGDRGARPLSAGGDRGGRVQRAHHGQDAHGRGARTAHRTPARPGQGRAGHAGVEPPVVAPRLHLRGRGLLAGDLCRLSGRAPRRSAPGIRTPAGRNPGDDAELLPQLFLHHRPKAGRAGRSGRRPAGSR